MTIDKKNNLWKWGLLIAALYFGPSILSHIRMAVSGHGQQVQRQIQQQTQQQTGPTSSSAKPQTYAILDALAGNWQGSAMIPDRGQCRMGLELQIVPGNEGHYSADTRLTCRPTLPAMIKIIGHPPGNTWELQDAMTKAMNLTSAILTGAAENGSIRFHVDQNIGVAQVPGACDMTSLTVTPFGATRIAIAYEETNVGHCHGGQIVADKVR
jgi:hypothetical protein